MEHGNMKTGRNMKDDLSQARVFLMGCAIIWIVLYHMKGHLVWKSGRIIELIDRVIWAGYGGCDIFLFLSGFGLAFSLAKEKSLPHYLGRRAKKIFPAYYPFICGYIVLMARKPGGITVQQVFGNLTFLGFWRGLELQFNWYIQAVMAFYLLAPAINWVMKRMGGGWRPLLVLLGVSAVLNVVYWGQYPMIAITRLPVFIIGFYLGTKDPAETAWTKTNILLLLGMLFSGVLFLNRIQPYKTWGNGLFWYPFILIAPAGALLVAGIRPFYLRCKPLYYLDKAVCVLGACSFEIYLIHDLFFEWLLYHMEGNQKWYALGLACVAAGIGYHYLVEYVVKNWSTWRKKAKEGITDGSI